MRETNHDSGLPSTSAIAALTIPSRTLVKMAFRPPLLWNVSIQ
jgi:hypothetical protein